MNSKELITGKTYFIGKSKHAVKIINVSETSFKARRYPENPLTKTLIILHGDIEVKETE